MKTRTLLGCLGVFVLSILILGVMLIIPLNLVENVLKPDQLNSGADPDQETLERMIAALHEIRVLKKNNAELLRLIGRQGNSSEIQLPVPDNHLATVSGDPSAAYEDTRRQLETNLRELWHTIRSKSKYIGEPNFEQVSDIYRILQGHLAALRRFDGFEGNRQRESKELGRIVQERIHTLQNPENCGTAKKIVCNLDKSCGFGCQIHHLCYCLVVAYGTSRTLILKSKGWRYNRGGWEEVFLPLSQTCTSGNGESNGEYSGTNSEQVVNLPIVDYLQPRPSFLPGTIPSDISDRLEKLHGEPHIWWVGQFIKYILRPQPHLQKLIDESKQKSGFEGPIVGLHIRRTDKIGSEASRYEVQKYMNATEMYFAPMERQSGITLKRRIFIASDDPSVIKEAKKAYPGPHWEILGDNEVAQSASLSQRYTPKGLNGIVRDVLLLSDCDFIVCTFSSQVCRLAYELLQTKHTDASGRFVSLDSQYYFGGGFNREDVAIMSHKSRNDNEIDFQVGDKIDVAGHHLDGTSKGTNRRTEQEGLFPSYKVRAIPIKVNFPENKWWETTREEIE